MKFPTIDKSSWPDGPWHFEADLTEFTTAAGLPALIARMDSSGCLNGYVQIPEPHPLHGQNYNVRIAMTDEIAAQAIPEEANSIGLLLESCKHDGLISLDVIVPCHGGLTFAGKLSGYELPGWWFGFDTSHCNDMTPGYEALHRSFSSCGGVYRDFAYVKSHVERLAMYLKVMQNVTIPQDNPETGA